MSNHRLDQLNEWSNLAKRDAQHFGAQAFGLNLKLPQNAEYARMDMDMALRRLDRAHSYRYEWMLENDKAEQAKAGN
jgi:hypothetical protein